MSRGLLGPIVILHPTTNNMTGTTTLNSDVMDFRLIRAGAIFASWTGTARGAIHIQGSLDYSTDPSGTVLNAGTWVDLDISLTAPTGSAGSSLLDISFIGIPFIRVQYVNSSGTGTLVVYGHGKGI